MCGRYATSRTPDDLVEEFRVEARLGLGPGEALPESATNFNLAPTDPAPVVLTRRPRSGEGSGEPDGDADQPDGSEPAPLVALRWLRQLRWGLVPSWSPDRRGAARMINARAESLLDKSFRRAALTRRCLVPADGWYEWQAGENRKQPFFMHSGDGAGLAFAGIYEFWRDDVVHPDDPGAWVTTFAIITVAAEPGLARIHDRMPLVLREHDWPEWLDPELTEPDAVRALLVPPPPGRFEARPVGMLVNSVANKGPQLVVEDLIGLGSEPLF